MFQTKEQDKTPEEKLSEVELNNLLDRVLSNNHEDDLRIQEKNGCRVESYKLVFFFFLRVRKYKNQPTRGEEYNNWNRYIVIKLTKKKLNRKRKY